MRTTTKKDWVNGHQVRGTWFHSLAFTIPLTPYAIMFCWGVFIEKIPANKLKVELYKLI